MARPIARAVPVPGATEMWHLRLYVAGETARSLRAFSNLKMMCEEHLHGRYEIEVIDLAQNPSLAATDDILGAVDRLHGPALGQVPQLIQGAEVAEEALGLVEGFEPQDRLEERLDVLGLPVVGHGRRHCRLSSSDPR